MKKASLEWKVENNACLHVLRPDRRYERLDNSGLGGITDVERTALLAMGASERHEPVADAISATAPLPNAARRPRA